ncbi:hypothetical protein JW926_03335 [Candidatus Sumerlaeota bacterium]|nr:hypothetical protein [Candidatus Sumerlaeota bacterium]
MSRSKRIDIPFSLYHVFSRTNSRERAFGVTPKAASLRGFIQKRYLAA